MPDFVSGKKQQSLPTGTRQGISREKGTISSDKSVYRSSAEESVRYKGGPASSVYQGSEEYFEYCCDPCNTAGDHVEAKGFCTSCEDYLCGTCFKNHSRNKASCNHALLDKDNMPKKSVKLCDPCKTAGDEEEAAGYCTDCGEYLCNSCFRSHSRNKASRQHVVLDKDNMPGWNDSAVASFAKMNISKRNAVSIKYNETYTYIRDINVKANEDEKNCLITSMTLVTSTELILVDRDNKSLKLVDLVNNVIKDSMRLHTFPTGLTKISQNQIALVLESECKIQIISVSEGLSVVQTLNIKGNCVGIKYINWKLYVSFWKPLNFQILQLTGAVYKAISPDFDVMKHCTRPRYIAVSSDKSMIYISDSKTNNVMCIGINGNMIFMYQGELDGSGDISISPSGSVYLSNRKQHVVYRMTSDLSEPTVILGRGDGLVYPHAMCFDADKQHIYISSGSAEAKSCNVIKNYGNFT